MILHPLSLPACPLFYCRNSVIVRPSNIIFARIYYQNICILPRKIPMNIQITHFRTWNSRTFRRFQLSTILFAFIQTNLDCLFWKIPTFYYFLSNYIIKIICRSGNHLHNQWNCRSRVHHCLCVFCGLYLGYPTELTIVVNSSHGGYCLTRLKSRTPWEGLIYVAP